MTASPYKFLNSYGIDDRNRSREAIVRPVGDEEVEPELVVRLLDDLVQTGLTVAGVPSPGDIEPAQLQIVCDTLWRAHGEGPLRLADYDGARRYRP
jgi:hypothetical protein